jgi:hypothetical protein
VVNTPDVKDEDLRFRLTRCDTQIQVEFDLIGHRMTWLMTSQSFLFAAFAVCVTTPQPRLLLLTKWLQFILSVVGVISALAVDLAIIAAHSVVERLKPVRQKLEKAARSKHFEALGVEVESREHRWGNLPSRILPGVLVVAWLLLLYLVVRFDI